MEGSLSIDDLNVQTRICKFLHEMSWRTERIWEVGDKIASEVEEKISEFNLPESSKQEIADQINAKRNQLNLMFDPEHLKNTTQTLMQNYDWYIAEVAGKQNFVISDNPLQMVLTRLNEICFPISPRKAIILRTKHKDGVIISTEPPMGGVIQLGELSVCKFNMIQLMQAKRYIFGDEFSIACLIDMAKVLAGGNESQLTIQNF